MEFLNSLSVLVAQCQLKTCQTVFVNRRITFLMGNNVLISLKINKYSIIFKQLLVHQIHRQINLIVSAIALSMVKGL